MCPLSVSKNSITAARGLQVDHYDYFNHTVFDVCIPNPVENDVIVDIITSGDLKHLALITSVSKKLIVYDLPLTEKCKTFDLPRSASKIRYTADDQHILVADKTGDVLIFNLKDSDSGTKLLGHLSLLLDILQTRDGKFIITCDRDEKIRVSCYPNSYNTHTYCLGHKEFVNHIELLPHNENFLVSTSGDGHIKLWNYFEGKLYHNIDTFNDIYDEKLMEQFSKAMDQEGVEVNALPIVHFATTKLDDKTSLMAVTVYNYNKLLLYSLQTENYSHKLLDTITIDKCPTAIQFVELDLFLYIDSKINVFRVTNVDGNVSVSSVKVIKMFENQPCGSELKPVYQESIKVLYKRKFDNVQEYQERKKQRIEKSEQNKFFGK